MWILILVLGLPDDLLQGHEREGPGRNPLPQPKLNPTESVYVHGPVVSTPAASYRADRR